jgi:hypothetical protein
MPFKPGQSGNPAGRPRKLTYPERMAQVLDANDKDEQIILGSKLLADLIKEAQKYRPKFGQQEQSSAPPTRPGTDRPVNVPSSGEMIAIQHPIIRPRMQPTGSQESLPAPPPADATESMSRTETGTDGYSTTRGIRWAPCSPDSKPMPWRDWRSRLEDD